MQTRRRVEPWWAPLAVWAIVNAVNVLQAIGFLSRVYTGSREINRLLGLVMIALATPAAVTLVALWRERAHWSQSAGLVVYLAFVLLQVAVEYVWPVEFRAPMRPAILVPYLVLFFGSIFLMGLPMFRLNRPLWGITVLTTVFLLASMVAAMRKGVG